MQRLLSLVLLFSACSQRSYNSKDNDVADFLAAPRSFSYGPVFVDAPPSKICDTFMNIQARKDLIKSCKKVWSENGAICTEKSIPIPGFQNAITCMKFTRQDNAEGCTLTGSLLRGNYIEKNTTNITVKKNGGKASWFSQSTSAELTDQAGNRVNQNKYQDGAKEAIEAFLKLF